jgi:hypothetical protein
VTRSLRIGSTAIREGIPTVRERFQGAPVGRDGARAATHCLAAAFASYRSPGDLELNGYTVVTYCASRLPAPLLSATEVMIVTCESSPEEVEALWRRCAACTQWNGAMWRTQLGHIRLGQAVALPITEEASGEVRLFTIGHRLTPHVRHREKYVDVPVTESRASCSPTARCAAAAPAHCVSWWDTWSPRRARHWTGI